MAETVHLSLKANGVDVKGDSTQTSLEREDTIECVYYEQSATSPREPSTGLAVGRRQYAPLLIRKRIDRSSPLLAKAFIKNEVIEGTFKFFRPSPAGDGTTEQFYTVHISQGRIVSIRQYVPDTLTPQSATLPPLEEVSLTFRIISWTYTQGGVTADDTWG
jgi:type VI secretion system secreted protein Hcp